MFTLSNFTMNLSEYTLTAPEISVLDKGLTFIPTTRYVPFERVLECKKRNIRNIKLRDYFRGKSKDYDPTLFKNKFQAPSDWVPPTRALSKAAIEAITTLSAFTASITRDRLIANSNPDRGPLLRLPAVKENITKVEAKAITQLKNNKNIIVKPADKGGAVCVLNPALYEAEGLRQLLNTNYYTEIHSPLANETVPRICSIIQELYDMGYLLDKQHAFLSPNVPAQARSFYLLPKVHKDRSKWPHPNMPEGRPIVADCGSETEHICAFIDHYLQPLATCHASYIKDTYHFVSKIRGQVVPCDALIVTGDVTGLYTNMDIDLTLQIIRETFQRNPDRYGARPDKQLLELLEITLRTNYFQFAGRLFLQTRGTAMGKRYAPSLANIFLQRFDAAARDGFYIKPLLYGRFLDDIFFLWLGSRDQLTEYGQYLNGLMPGIKVTLCIREQLTEYLDTIVYKAPYSATHCFLRTRVYFKPTDTHQLLYASSFHPKHTVKGILKSQILRFKRLSTTNVDFYDACHELYCVLRGRGYSRSLYRNTVRFVVNHDFDTSRELDEAIAALDPPQEKDQLWPIINYYDPLSTQIARQSRELISKLPYAGKYRLINAYKIHDNLRRKLVRSRFDGTSTTVL